VFELVDVLYQPHTEPNARAARKRKSTTSDAEKIYRKRRHVKGSSHSGDQTSAQELALAEPLKQSKKFISHSSGPSSTGGSGAAQAPARALDLSDSGSSASDGETANPTPPQKCPRKSTILKDDLKPFESPALKGTLEHFLFLRLS
jgi:hypothetical protein